MAQFDLNELAFAIHTNAVRKGFWDANTEDNRIIFYLKQIAMIHSECSETLEAIRKEKGDEIVVEELADIIIRVLDLWAGMSLDQYTNASLKDVLYAKVKTNETRPMMHGVLA
jgi:NTP pyrophosphatase (non-canonical NTP hydrolase)